MKTCIKCDKEPVAKTKQKGEKITFKIYCFDCGRNAKGATAEEAESVWNKLN